MVLRNPTLMSFPSRILNTFSTSRQCVRCLHKNVVGSNVPPPTPFVPDVPTFLSLIGRQMSKHSSKFSSWDDLFTMSSQQLREAGLEPTHQRRYLLRWREKFRRGEYGIGGDLKNVVDGVAEVRVVEVPNKSSNRAVKRAKDRSSKDDSESQQPHGVTASITSNPKMKNTIVNLLPGETPPKDLSNSKKPDGFRLFNGNKVRAPFLKTVAGSNGTVGRLEVQEGMWEDKLGRKIDGGERRRAEVQAKKRSEERKKAAI